MEEHQAETVRIDIPGVLDCAAVEALRLEVFHLARQYGIEVKDFRIEKVNDG